MALPMSAGLCTTVMPAAARAFIFSAAVPLPPEMMAPAWPMRRPGGAVWPAMKATTGLFMLALTQAAASSSALPPISPIMMTAWVSGSSLNSSRASMKLVPLMGSPPMPMQVVWPMPRAGELAHGLVGEGAGAADHAHVALLVDVAGHDADLGLAGADDARAVGADEAALGIVGQHPLDLHHVEDRDALGDADDQLDARVQGLEDGVRRGQRAARRSWWRWRRSWPRRP